MSQNLPRIKAGVMLPTKASRVGELFVLTGTNAAGIYRVRSLSPLTWVREPSVQTGSEFQTGLWKFASVVVHCNTSQEQVLYHNQLGADALVYEIIITPLSGDFNAFEVVGQSLSLLITASNVQLPASLAGQSMSSLRNDMLPIGPTGPTHATSLIISRGDSPFVLNADTTLFAQWMTAAQLPYNPGLPHVLLVTVLGMFLD